MKLVIDIDEEIYLDMKEGDFDYARRVVRSLQATIADAIINGTPLPKGHGRIVDIDKVLEEMRATRTYDIPFALERVKPIIEVAGGEEDEASN